MDPSHTKKNFCALCLVSNPNLSGSFNTKLNKNSGQNPFEIPLSLLFKKKHIYYRNFIFTYFHVVSCIFMQSLVEKHCLERNIRTFEDSMSRCTSSIFLIRLVYPRTTFFTFISTLYNLLEFRFEKYPKRNTKKTVRLRRIIIRTFEEELTRKKLYGIKAGMETHAERQSDKCIDKG